MAFGLHSGGISSFFGGDKKKKKQQDQRNPQNPMAQQQAQRLQNPQSNQPPQQIFAQKKNNRLGNLQDNQAPQPIIPNLGPNTKGNNAGPLAKPIDTVATSAARVATGVAQAGSGLVDLFSPGKGTSRVTKSLNKTAEQEDKYAKQAGVNAPYKVANVAGEVGSYFIPGVGVEKVASKLPKVTQVTKDVVDKASNFIDKGGDVSKLRDLIADGMRKGLTFEQALTDTVINAKYTGEQSAKGEKVTPSSAAENAATSIAGGILPPVISKFFRDARSRTPGDVEKKFAEGADKLLNERSQPKELPKELPKDLSETAPPQQRAQAHTNQVEQLTQLKQELQDEATKQAEAITKDTSLTPENKVAAARTAQAQFKDAMDKVDANIEQSKQAVDQANQEIQNTVDSAQAASAQTKAAQVEQATPAPTAAPEVPATEVSQNNGYKTIQDVVQDTENARGQKQNIFKRFGRGVKRELYDPRADLANLDRELAKQTNTKYEDLDPRRRLTQLYADAQNSANEADRLLVEKQGNGQSVAQLLYKYGVSGRKGESAPAWKEFNQFLNLRFALEVLQKSEDGQWILGDQLTPQNAARIVQTYAAKNPEAINDAITIKQWADKLTDVGVQSGELDPQFAEFIKGNYQNYVPLSRTYSDDLVRPKITGGTGNSVGQQNVVRFLSGSSQPLEDEAGALIDRGRQVVRKANENRFVNEILQRHQANTHGDRFSLEVDPDVTAYNREVTDLYDQAKQVLDSTRGDLRDLKGQKRTAQANVRTSTAEKRAAEAQAAGRVRQLLVAISKRRDLPNQAFGDIAPFANNLSDKQALQLLDVIAQYDPKQLRTAVSKIERSNKKLAGLTDAVADLQDRVNSTRANIADQQGATTSLFDAMRGSTQRVGTGKQVLQGFRQGDKFAVGIDPQLADTLAYLNGVRDDAIGNLSSNVAVPLKTVATGALTPVFAVKNKVRNELLKFVNTDVTRTYDPRAIAESFRGGLFNKGQFFQDLTNAGYIAPTATRTVQKAGDSARHLAVEGGGTFAKIAYDAKNPKRWLHVLNKFGGQLDNMDRVQIARGEYQHWLAKTGDHDLAIKYAARAANNALGDFQNVSKTARRLEAITPYAGATQAGYRALVDGFRARPVTTGLKVGALAGTVYGLAATNIFDNDAAKDYYKEAVDQNRTYDLDSNLIFVLPGAHRNENGEWSGIIKIPVAPDFQPLVRTAWRTAFDQANGRPVNTAQIAQSLGSFATADETRALYQKGSGAFGGALPSSPALQYVAIGMNVNPQTGQPLGDADTVKQGYTSATSNFAMNMSKALGGKISPLQIDALANTQGFAGDILQNKAGSVEGTVKKAFGNIFSGAKTQSDKQQNYIAFENVRDEIGDEKQRALFDAIHKSRSYSADELKSLGVDPRTAANAPAGMLDGATKALILLGNEQVLNAEMKLAARNKEQGKPADPLFDPDLLTSQERNAILTYRQGKIYNAASQNKDKNGDSAFTALGLDDPWYQKYKQAEDAYYANFPKTGSSDTVKTFSGYADPKATPELQQKLDYYYTLPKGTGDRSRFLNANQDVLDFWAKQNDFTQQERAALGFAPIAADNGGGPGGGGFGTSYGLLPHLTNFGGNTVPQLQLNIDKKQEADIYAVLRKLFAPGASSVSDIQLGASSRGDV